MSDHMGDTLQLFEYNVAYVKLSIFNSPLGRIELFLTCRMPLFSSMVRFVQYMIIWCYFESSAC